MGVPISGNDEQAALVTRFRERRLDLEQDVLARVYGIDDPTAVSDRRYVEGLRRAVAAGLDYGLATIERDGAGRVESIPAELFAQASLAARSGVSLDTVLRRYCGGHAIFADLLVDEAERTGISRTRLKTLLRGLSSSFDRLLAAVGDEYARELESMHRGREQRRLDLVRRMLAGELIDVADLGYELHFNHLAIVARGAAAQAVPAALGGALDRRLLEARPDQQTSWIWLGGRREFDELELELIFELRPAGTALACGEPAAGPAGWRLTHRQAEAALAVAERGGQPFVRYGDVALVASVIQDDLLVAALRQDYLEPLETARDGGDSAKRTLRAYFAANHNVTSTAAALKVKRHTVTNRLRGAEEKLGRPLATCAAELEAALRLDEITAPGHSEARTHPI